MENVDELFEEFINQYEISQHNAVVKAIARADSAVLVTKASAEAKANQLKQVSVTPKLLQQQWIEKWNGSTPTVVTGSGSGFMLNLKEIKE
jgi:4-diphosphocytidyl-2C-methyl-D-erythritol kinase